jgi:hypothetical protein
MMTSIRSQAIFDYPWHEQSKIDIPSQTLQNLHERLLSELLIGRRRHLMPLLTRHISPEISLYTSSTLTLWEFATLSFFSA